MLNGCLKKQQKVSEAVFDNLNAELKKAVGLEKQNRISDIAGEFGVSTNNLALLQGKLVPSLPKTFRDLKITADTINSQMDVGKRFKLLGAAEIHSWAQKSLKNERWAKEKECTYKNPNYQNAHGHFEE